MEDEVLGEGGAVGPATGLVGFDPRGSASGQSPTGAPRGPTRDREVNWTVKGALLAWVPLRGRLGQRDVRGQAGRSRPHHSWGFSVMEVREIVVGKDVSEVVIEGKGGRETLQTQEANGTDQWGCFSVPLAAHPLPQ